jgi:hypothetical protein
MFSRGIVTAKPASEDGEEETSRITRKDGNIKAIEIKQRTKASMRYG